MAQGGCCTAALRLSLAQWGVLLLVLLLVMQGVQVLVQAGLRGVLGRVLVLLPQCVRVCICIRTCGDLQEQWCLRKEMQRQMTIVSKCGQTDSSIACRWGAGTSCGIPR